MYTCSASIEGSRALTGRLGSAGVARVRPARLRDGVEVAVDLTGREREIPKG